MKKHLLMITLVAVVLLGAYIVGKPAKTAAPAAPKHSTASTSNQSKSASAKFNKTQYSLSEPSSIWVVVDKLRPLEPKAYTPKLVVPNVKLKSSASAENMHVSTVIAPALETLFAAANKSGVPLMLSSGYRSYSYQVSVYSNEVSRYGQSRADEESARPSYSEHQTGFAADVAPASGTCDLQQCFGATPAGKWLTANAYKYGFIIRYPEGKQDITGYEYEPWHIRYIGPELSTEMHKDGITTLEEFFELPPAPDYK